MYRLWRAPRLAMLSNASETLRSAVAESVVMVGGPGNLLVRHWRVSIGCAMMCDVGIVVRPAVGTPVANESVSDGFTAVEINVFI